MNKLFKVLLKTQMQNQKLRWCEILWEIKMSQRSKKAYFYLYPNLCVCVYVCCLILECNMICTFIHEIHSTTSAILFCPFIHFLCHRYSSYFHIASFHVDADVTALKIQI